MFGTTITYSKGESWRILFAGFRRDRNFDGLAVAEHFYFYRLTDFHRVEGIGVIVNVRNFLAGELGDDVAWLDPRLFRGTASFDAGQLHSFHFGGIVGDRPEIGAK